MWIGLLEQMHSPYIGGQFYYWGGSWAQLSAVTLPNRTFVETFIIGRLVMHVVVPDGFRKKIDGPIIDEPQFDDCLIRIWPPQEDPLQWRPPRALVLQHLHAVHRRYRWWSKRGPGRVFKQPMGKYTFDPPEAVPTRPHDGSPPSG